MARTAQPVAELASRTYWAAEQTGGRFEQRHDLQPAVAPPPPLTTAQIEHFKREGYVSSALVRAACAVAAEQARADLRGPTPRR
jgi:hypothetical protein